MKQVQTSFIPGAEYEMVFDPSYRYRVRGDLATKLRLAARRCGKSMAEVVREALRAYLRDELDHKNREIGL